MFKEDLTFLPPASLPVGFPHASHSLPHSLPSLPFSLLLLQFSIHSSAVLFFRFVLFFSIMQDFRSAVMKAEGEDGEPVLEEQRLREILGVLPQVHNLHSSILNELEERISQW